MLHKLFPIEPDTTIITATQRLSLLLSELANDNTLGIVSFSNWVEQLAATVFALGNAAPSLLTDYQEILLWESIIDSTNRSGRMLRTSSFAVLAQQAWRQLQSWEQPINNLFDINEESYTFKNWARAYKECLQQNNWQDQHCLITQINSLLPRIPTPCSKNLIFTGFLEFTPQQKRLLATLKTLGIKCNIINPSLPNPAPAKIIKLDNKNDELLTMATWVKNTLKTTNAELIGCVIPNINEQRQTIQNTLARSLATHNLILPEAENSIFTVSANIPLSEYPLIYTALQCLKSLHSTLSIDDFSTLVLSPFISGNSAEYNNRALFDAQLRHQGERTLTLKNALLLLNSLSTLQLPILQLLIQRLLLLQKRLPSAATASEWREIFSHTLKLLGWPGERSLNSNEYQTLKRWEQALNEFAALDFLLSAMNFKQAYHYITRLVEKINFQPEKKSARVHLLSPTDAIGFPGQHLWVMNFTDEHWPPAPKPNPFIPFGLQHQLQMPHATAAQEKLHSELLLKQLTTSAANTVISYAVHDKDQVARPSRILSNLSTNEIKLELIRSSEQQVSSQKQDAYPIHDKGPPLTQNFPVKGGIGIFKDQAACPFKAFAQHRLGARSIKKIQSGLTSIERGSLPHKAMEYFWKKTLNHATLCSYSDSELDTIILRSIQKALLELKKKRPQLLKPRFMALETQRLTKILRQWLALEKQRPAFNVIATEQQHDISFGSIPLQIRIDRVDQLPNGEYLIIDYKTGACNENDWLGERPDDPQLPFYCISTALTITGVMFARLSTQELKFKGIVNRNNQQLAPANLKPITDWQEQMIIWQTVLAALADEFRNGIANVAPKNGDKTCQRCDMKILCRFKGEQR